MKEIELTQGKFAMVDDEDYEFLTQWKWRHGCTHNYAVRTQHYRVNKKGKGKTIQMHRIVMDAPKGIMVDHINGNSLDNRKENLRFCNNGQNQSNSLSKKGSSSVYKGVNFHKNKWRATITINKKSLHLGTYDTEKEAALAYNTKAKEVFGDFSRLNIIDGEEKTSFDAIKVKVKKSKFVGVSRCSKRPETKWRTFIYINGKQKHLGLYSSEIDAAKAYNYESIRVFGEFAKINVILD